MDAWPTEEFVETRATFTLQAGDKLVLIENVPARVCVQTGERPFAPDVVERLREIVWDQKCPVRVIETSRGHRSLSGDLSC
ncbi:MAG: YgiT-type zinc finger protein [Planctomycetaceae bacterium]